MNRGVAELVRGHQVAHRGLVLLGDAPEGVARANAIPGVVLRRPGGECRWPCRPLDVPHVLLGEHSDMEVRRPVLLRGLDHAVGLEIEQRPAKPAEARALRPAEIDRHPRRVHREVRAVARLAAFGTNAARHHQRLPTDALVLVRQSFNKRPCRRPNVGEVHAMQLELVGTAQRHEIATAHRTVHTGARLIEGEPVLDGVAVHAFDARARTPQRLRQRRARISGAADGGEKDDDKRNST